MIAEASADAEKVRAAADATAKKHEADGDAYAQRTVAAAEAEAINVRAASLADGNQALIAANKLIDVLPSLVAEAAKGISGSNLTILNGTDGVNQVAAGVVSQGLSIYEALRHSVASTKATQPDPPTGVGTNGKDEKAATPKALPPQP
jgi:flotillin